MVRAELIYNPYLLETEVRFNGNPPRINSLIEKYQKQKLQNWINNIPSIFYDEMNGYEFELDFSGTDLDFKELKDSFSRAGVGKNLVKLSHKERLGSREEKVLAIDDFLEWLGDNPNRKFDLQSFKEKNKDIFESAYSLVVVGGTVITDSLFEGIEIAIDSVASVDELRKTDLHSTPILFYLDRRSAGMLQHNLAGLLRRRNVSQGQIFFMVSPVLGKKIIRVLQDLGVKEPQVVLSADDGKILRYMQLFPVSEYIYDAVSAFRKQADALSEILEESGRQSELTNKDIHEQLRSLDSIRERLKAANARFSINESLDIPIELEMAKEEFIKGINIWKAKKTKITKFEEARLQSKELEAEVMRLFERFKRELNRVYPMKCDEIQDCCGEWYRSAKYKEDYIVNGISRGDIMDHSIPGFADELLKIKEEQYVTPKDDFFGKIFRGGQDGQQREPVLEITFFYEKWRSFAASVAEPVAEEMVQEVYFLLKEYYRQVREGYESLIAVSLDEVSTEKAQVSSRLSEDEKKLQEDNDWYCSFCDKLHGIERA